jgi:DNA-binding HxlR family transcriptional regulator
MALLDLLGRRWTLRVLWELRDGGAQTFRGLQASCGHISSSVLNERIGELREAGILAAEDGEGYRLSEDGLDLVSAVSPLNEWAERWGRRSAPR